MLPCFVTESLKCKRCPICSCTWLRLTLILIIHCLADGNLAEAAAGQDDGTFKSKATQPRCTSSMSRNFHKSRGLNEENLGFKISSFRSALPFRRRRWRPSGAFGRAEAHPAEAVTRPRRQRRAALQTTSLPRPSPRSSRRYLKMSPFWSSYLQSGAARHSQGFEDKNLGSSPAGGPLL